MIKDSGDRTGFASGAVRDMHDGKGRCDLLPACAILRLARHFEAGAKKYDDRNWEKGIPIHSFIDSGIRHLMNYLDGKTDEDHLCAAAWNIMCAMWTEEKHPELQDIPARMVQKSDPQLTVEAMNAVIQLYCGNDDHGCGDCKIKSICGSIDGGFTQNEDACRKAYAIIQEAANA